MAADRNLGWHANQEAAAGRAASGGELSDYSVVKCDASEQLQ